MSTEFERKLLELHEGRAARLYKCPAGYNTLGVGHNLDANPISDRAIDVILEDDILNVERDLDRFAPWWRQEDAVRQAALIDLCFNMGWPKLSEFRVTLGLWQGKKYDRAADALVQSKWFGQTGQRARRVVTMVRTGEFPTL